MQAITHVTFDASTLEKLLHHAAFAPHLVGQLNDETRRDVVGQLGDQVDAIAHQPTELLGNPQARAAPDTLTPDDRETHDGAPLLTSSAGVPRDSPPPAPPGCVRRRC